MVQGQTQAEVLSEWTATSNLLVRGADYFGIDGVLLPYGQETVSWLEIAQRVSVQLGSERVWGMVTGPNAWAQEHDGDALDAEDAVLEQVKAWILAGVGGVLVREPVATSDLADQHLALERLLTHHGKRMMLALERGNLTVAGRWWAVACAEPGNTQWVLQRQFLPVSGPGIVLCWPWPVEVEETIRFAQRRT